MGIDFFAAADEGAWALDGVLCYPCGITFLGTGRRLLDAYGRKDESYGRLGYFRYVDHRNHPDCVVTILFDEGEEAYARRKLIARLAQLKKEAA